MYEKSNIFDRIAEQHASVRDNDIGSACRAF